MDEMRAQLSMLMGSLQENSSTKGRQFTDQDVCKLYLTGLCPHDLFANTKHYMGPCDKVHSDELKDIYMEARKEKRYGYEEEAIRMIQPLVDDSDRKIGRGQVRCEEDNKASVEENDELKMLNTTIDEKIKLADDLGSAGDVEASMRLMEEIKTLTNRKAVLEDPNSVEYSFNQKLKPCEVCGALLSGLQSYATDSDRRLSEHFSGKIHIGFQLLRDALKALKSYLENAPPELNSSSYRGHREAVRSLSAEREYSRSKRRGEDYSRRDSSRFDRREKPHHTHTHAQRSPSREYYRSDHHHHHHHHRRSDYYGYSSRDKRRGSYEGAEHTSSSRGSRHHRHRNRGRSRSPSLRGDEKPYHSSSRVRRRSVSVS